MYINFRSQTFYTFLVIWTHVLLLLSIARRLYLLFTGKEQTFVFMQNFKFGGMV